MGYFVKSSVLTEGPPETKRALIFLKYFIYLLIFKETGREGEREGDKRQCVVASHMPPLGTWPTTQACALTGNRTSDSLVHRQELNAHQPGQKARF